MIMFDVRPEAVKILIVAEHASAAFGGEALIPYQYFKSLREVGAEVYLLVHERTRDELLAAFPGDIERIHFVADSAINRWCWRLGKFMPNRLAVFTVGALSHFVTQVRQRRCAQALIEARRVDIVHEPIPVSPKLPSMMFGLQVPLVVGPLNGGMEYPPNFDLASRLERSIVFILRRMSVFLNWLFPGKRNAALILVANKRTRMALPSNLRARAIVEFAENGVDVERFNAKALRASSDTLRMIYVGRLVDWKRVDLLISACSRLVGKVGFEAHIVGDGPLRNDLEKQVRQLSLADNITFHGWLPQSVAAEMLRLSDIMVLPSMLECGGAVVLEAMASGIPVVAANWGGPAEYVDKDAGILVSPTVPDTFVSELAEALLWMAHNPEARVQMGKAGRRRVEEDYDWRVKARRLLRIYENVRRESEAG
jgi:glycosyltransferase involved in cell wall biosynthesis